MPAPLMMLLHPTRRTVLWLAAAAVLIIAAFLLLRPSSQEQATQTVRDYVASLAVADYQGGCSHLTGLAEFAAQNASETVETADPAQRCQEGLARLDAQGALPESSDALRSRQGASGAIIVSTPSVTMTLTKTGGDWKIAELGAG